ncbi:unnamed protein product [Ambrosiozyma monospora]|uniref:tRNA (guanine(26)-N(2))-dimethyltransferase n=1 Tax=Ambrosiozyma monospora TaxID=43982 RepID=A0A9W7DED4_AMBMO|nr:unnamed protein product [Ambrosiozyma monospora]
MTSESQPATGSMDSASSNITESTTAKPAFDTNKYEELVEGSAKILFPKSKVFYNPVQQYNRDLSSLAIRAFSELLIEEKQAKKRNKQPKSNRPNKKQIDQATENTTSGTNTTPTTSNTADITEEKKNSETTEQLSKASTSTCGTEEQVEESSSSPSQEPYLNILEALSATGLRAIRYGKEIPLAQTVIANDLSKAAVDAIQLNVDYNDIAGTVIPNEADAINYMANNKSKFHVVDLDPYGTASPFIDTALNAIKDDGLMLITCTDLGVLAGNGYPEKCFALYGGTNLWGDATHESALRLVLNMIANTAAKYKKYIEPQLCLSIDFYVRLFIRVKTSPINVKLLASQTMITYNCSGCHATANQFLGKVTANPNSKSIQNSKKFGLAKGPPVGPTCSFCGSVHHLCGPMWGGRIQNPEFIDRVLKLQDEASSDIYKTLPRIKD